MSTIKVCDKCGTIVPFVALSLNYNDKDKATIDLCGKCRYDFFEWLNKKEEENG